MTKKRERENRKGDAGKSTRFRKGQSGNPSGRPKSSFALERTLRERCIEVDPRDRHGRTHYEVIVAKMITVAKKGSVRAFEELNNRLFGKAPQSIALSGNVGLTTREERVAHILDKIDALKGVEQSPQS
jgi:Family of unknown function (DUF5681)